MMSKMMQAALEYASMGFSVFPLTEGSKIPLKGSAGVHDATQDTETICRWWTEMPMCNIGIAMGNGFVAIDFDEDEEKDKHGIESLRRWEYEHRVELPDTIISLTPRGGAHYIYKDPIGHGNKVDLYNGVDVRGNGGYIVAPPSRIGEKRYQWEYSPDEVEIATADDVVLDFLEGEHKEGQQGRFKLPKAIYAGEQEITFMKLFGALWNLGLSEESIRSVISIENDLRFEPSWTDRELERVVFPALNRGWDVSRPYWNLKEGEIELWWMQRKIELLERKIQLLTEN